MADTLETPLGHISKKTALIGGVVIVVAGGLLYRYEKQKQAVASAGANTGIDPATGYAYGSAEDANALASQAAYISPVGGGIGSGNGLVGSIPSGGTGLPQGFTSNPAWVQYVVDYMTTKDLVQDGGAQLSAALGVYIAGQVPTSDQISLIQQAIAIAGYPPISADNGYPPHINTNPPGNTTPPPSGGGTTPPPDPGNDIGTGKSRSRTTITAGETVAPVLAYFNTTQQQLDEWNPGITYYNSSVGLKFNVTRTVIVNGGKGW